MTREIPDEDVVFAEIADRLRERYPQASPVDIEAALGRAREHFHDARVRDFIPVLVEREARAVLDQTLSPG
ncbi:hypothetical protein QSU92_17290 [Microbacterium sp. ET2]|uniref:three-helix bundle dimerization domain-containing protein n=1 Tax=Microbacterium albipurpureum TaxID=3050384 RepID=UPI00259CBCBB|nr:hypothetical protein [Microbacterium sp. ET2 (Ac-2212)]WJL95640.1 hypothetical protein QSU92_17290 [Microbacterium sp. ET2 (Ac-2212)]